MSRPPLHPDIQAAIEALYAGVPLGTVIDRLTAINDRQIIESYASGLPLRQCGERHGVPWGHVNWIIRQTAPDLMRSRGRRWGKQ